MYRVQFDCEPKAVTPALDFLSTIKAYNVEWTKADALHRLSFMFDGRSAPKVLDFTSENRVHNVVGPVPAVEVSGERAPIAEVINLKGRKQVTTADLQQALEAAGRSAGSVGYLAKALRDAGLIKYHEGKTTTGIYDVVGPKKAGKRKGGKRG